jgi:hypothetical protein
LSQEDHEFEASLGYNNKFEGNLDYIPRPSLTKNQKQNKKESYHTKQGDEQNNLSK